MKILIIQISLYLPDPNIAISTYVCEISSSHGGWYDVQNCLYMAVYPRRQF
jgi:hypothetical protein